MAFYHNLAVPQKTVIAFSILSFCRSLGVWHKSTARSTPPQPELGNRNIVVQVLCAKYTSAAPAQKSQLCSKSLLYAAHFGSSSSESSTLPLLRCRFRCHSHLFRYWQVPRDQVGSGLGDLALDLQMHQTSNFELGQSQKTINHVLEVVTSECSKAA